MIDIKLTRKQSDELVRVVSACVEASKRFETRTGLESYAHLCGGLQGVLEIIEPRLKEVFQ